jgi:hypothetical protein
MKFRVVPSQITLSSITLLSAIFLMSSCRDDDAKSNNHFTLDELKKPLKAAVLFYDQEPMDNDVTGETFFRNDLILYTGFDLITEDDGEKEFSGEGDAVLLSINTSSQNLEEGTYTWTGTEEDPSVFDFWSGNVILSYNTTTEVGESWDFIDGEIQVSKSGDVYTIMLTGTIDADLNHDGDFEDVQVSASYKGKITHTED